MLELQIVYWTLSDERVALIYDNYDEVVLKINLSKNRIERIQDWKFDIVDDVIKELDVNSNIQFGRYVKDGLIGLLNELIEDGAISRESEDKVLKILEKEKEN